MTIRTNMESVRAVRILRQEANDLSRSLEKLASGYAINRAADDAAGLAITEKMRFQITGVQGAQYNTQDAVSLIQTADGALGEVHEMLGRMHELSLKAANGVYTTEERGAIQEEMDALGADIDRIAQGTNFNGLPLLDGRYSADSPVFSATPAYYESDVDLSHAMDGSHITVDGVSFEFDADGELFDPGAVAVDISACAGDSAADKEARAQAFAAALEASVLKEDYTFTCEPGAEGLLHLRIDAQEPMRGEDEIAVAYQQVPDIRHDPLDIHEAPTLKALVYSGLRYEDFRDGSTLRINDIVLEFRHSLPLQNPGAYWGDLNQPMLRKAMQAGFGGSTVPGLNVNHFAAQISDGTVNLTLTDRDKKVEVFEFNSPGTTPTDMDGKNVVSKASEWIDEGEKLFFQIGASREENTRLCIEGASCADLGIASLSVADEAAAGAAADATRLAINQVSRIRAGLGAAQNRLEHTLNALGNTEENLTAARSRIKDTDMALRMTQYIRENLISQVAQSMLAQSNQAPNSVLQLLQ